MRLKSFLYRQKSKLQYHTAKDDVGRAIAEINRNRRRIVSNADSYNIPEALLVVPKGSIDHLFCRFDLLIENMVNLKGRYEWREETLYFLFDEFCIPVSTPNELFIINEIFFHRCYNYETPDHSQYYVIDIGMNVGLASLFFAEKKRVKRVFAYEPVRESYTQAVDNFRMNQHLCAKIEAFNFGLGNSEKKQHVRYDPMASGTTGVASNRSINPKTLERLIEVKDAYNTLSGIMDANPDAPFLLKIDCEGAELEIIDSLVANGFPRQIQAIVMEWHGTLGNDVARLLSQAGMKMFFTRLKSNLGLIYAFR